MHRTIFNTPLINTLMHWLSRLILRLLGWQIEGKAPAAPKYVLIAAPHTSNWDFPFTLMVCFALRMPVYWMGQSQPFPARPRQHHALAGRHSGLNAHARGIWCKAPLTPFSVALA
jgi:hypothetical protein